MGWTEVSSEDVEVGKEVFVRWVDGPATIEVEGYLAFVNNQFRKVPSLELESGQPPRTMCILFAHEAYWYNVDDFASIWVKTDDGEDKHSPKTDDGEKGKQHD